jgi:hypothetical protein
MKIIIFILSALMCLISTELYALEDPFDSPPVNSIRNCSGEYRFKFNENIQTPEEFIEFLKKHQEGNKFFNVPTKDRLIPMYVERDPSSVAHPKADMDKSKIKVEPGNLKKFIEILDIENSLRLNKKIYKLSFGWGIYSGHPYAWRITITMSDNGDVSIRYCAGK